MFTAGVNSSSGSSLAVENECSYDIPEWKKILIMKKRAGNSSNVADDSSRRNLDSDVNIANRNGCCSNTCDSYAAGGTTNKFGRSAVKVAEQDFREISQPKTVTFGNINVELRCVKTTPENHFVANISKTERNRISNGDLKNDLSGEDCEDLQYGPGIVDRLRAKFLNMGAKQQCKPVVRRFSSLENLPGSNTGPYRVNSRGARQNGFKYGTGPYVSGHVKKAQSMETLICTTPEQQIFTSSRRPNARYVGGVKGRILNKNSVSSISVLTDENYEPGQDKSPSPSVSPRLFSKSIRRWDYSRSNSTTNINEDELPKPDTVKHVKKIFESPPNSSEKSSSTRFRKVPTPTPLSNGAILGSARTAVKEEEEEEDCLLAKSSAKESLCVSSEELLLSPDDCKINKEGYSPVLGDNISVNGSCDYFSRVDICSTAEEIDDLEEEGIDDISILEEDVPDSTCKVTAEQLPLEEVNKHFEVLSQGSQVAVFDQVERLEDEDFSPRPAGVSSDSMVVAAGDGVSAMGAPHKKGTSAWQKAPQATTSIVFDFRGKDVKPNISLNPTPFGCRPAKVSRNTNKRSGSPPRAEDYPEEERNSEGDEDWDEMDIGADLPAHSGIVFIGENVKVGRGALLETRNKKLSLKFDSETYTIEFPSVSDSSPEEDVEDNRMQDPSVSSTSSSRLGDYTPQVLTSNNDFQLGITQSNPRPVETHETIKDEDLEDIIGKEAITPTSPDEAEGFSAAESDDMLF